jgi:putative transposase
MPRQARLDVPGYFYHVIVRGIERRPIFRAERDRSDFVDRLAKGLSTVGGTCLTWALMTNHVHLLILAGARGLAALMHPLLTGYAGAFNRRYGRIGHLVQNRYKAILCQEDPYLLQLLRYIALNPVRAKIVRTPEALSRYPWTGHSAILGELNRPWQAVDEVLGRFGTQRSSAQSAYEQWVIESWDEGHRNELEGGGLIRSLGGGIAAQLARRAKAEHSFDTRILGLGEFADKVLREADQRQELQEAARQDGLTLKRLRYMAAEALETDPAALLGHDRRRRVAQARALWIYTATELLAVPSRDLADKLKMSSGSVSEARKRGRDLASRTGFLERATGGRSSEQQGDGPR